MEPANWPAIRLWERVQTQWSRGNLNQKLGLNYDGCEVVAGKLGLDFDEVLFTHVQIMEQRALQIENERLKRSLEK